MGRSWNDWKTNPIFSRLSLVNVPSSSVVVVVPSITTAPSLGKSIAPAKLRRVDLPHPLRPTSETN